MMIYESRPAPRTARRVWDIVSSSLPSGTSIFTLWYNRPGDGDYAGRWCFDGKAEGLGRDYTRLEGWYISGSTVFYSWPSRACWAPGGEGG